MGEQEIKKNRSKDKIGYLRNDIEFYTNCIEQYKKLHERHCHKSHNNKNGFHIGCELCGLYRESINDCAKTIKIAKEKITDIIKGE